MYFRYHVDYNSPKTGQPVGLFVAVYHLLEGHFDEMEKFQYWENRLYFEEVLPVPPFYADGNSLGAVTWFKENEKTMEIIEKMSFYFKILEKYNVRLELAKTDNPGRIIYEDDYQVGVLRGGIT